MKGLKQIFGSQVRFWRKERGWTQAELADRVDLSADMVGRIERGSAGPSIESIEKLAVVLDVQPALLFGAPAISRRPSRRA